jgi:hypothetical protein
LFLTILKRAGKY